MPDEIIIRSANFSPGRAKPVLQEVYTFGEQASLANQTLTYVGPGSLLTTDRLIQCDEAYVAEYDQKIVGAVTLAFQGVYAPKMPTIDALYVLPDFTRQGIGMALFQTAIKRLIELGKTPVFVRVSSAQMVNLVASLETKHPNLWRHLKIKDDC